MSSELLSVHKLLREYGLDAEYRPPRITYGPEDELVWVPVGFNSQIEVEYFPREDAVSLPATFVVTGRSYSPDHGMAGETLIGSVYEPEAVLALVKWILTTIESED